VGASAARIEGPESSSRASDAGPPSEGTTFDADRAGGPSSDFEAVVGDWAVGEQAGARGFFVDGSRWRDGVPSATLSEQAKRLYGDRYAEFLDGVKTFAFFPLALWKGLPIDGDVRVSVRFFPLGGTIDQAAGIALGVGADGSYSVARANALEDNLLWAKVVRGRRTILDTVRDVPTPSKVWHELSIVSRGTSVEVSVDGIVRLKKSLDAPLRGRLGLWSKADSRVLFDDFKVERLGR
jgi:hypothetical protein